MSTVQYILRYLELLSAFASLYWLTQGGGVEAAIAFTGFLATFVVQDIRWSIRAEERKRNREKDKELFDELLQLISSDNLYFLKNHGHDDSFDDSQVKGITRFVDTWDRVDREFIDTQLERLKKGFYETAKKYVSVMGRYTFSDGYGTRRLSEELFYRDEGEWYAQEKELNEQAAEAAQSLEVLIRAGRKKL